VLGRSAAVQNFLPCERDQQFLLPPSLTDWLPEDHLAWFVIDSVDQMDLSGFRASYRADGWGRAAHDPAMMVSLMLYAYCVGERSSRRIERRCVEDVAFRVLVANQRPDHSTIARFRQRHTHALTGVFVQVLRLCQQAGLVRLGVVALDGTKIAGSAALTANRTRDQIAAQVAAMLAEADAVDAAEDAADDGQDQTPAVLRGRADRRRRLAEAKAQLDAEDAAAAAAQEHKLRQRAQAEAAQAAQGRKLTGRKPKPVAAPTAERRRNTSDPDSRVMKSAKGWVQGYNGQALVGAGQIILAAQAVNDPTDVGQFQPMLQAGAANLATVGVSDPIRAVVADAGYYSQANIIASGPEPFIATTNRRKRDLTPPRGRIPTSLSIMGRMERKLRTKHGQALYRRRSQIVEPVFGQIKHVRGITRLLRRGLAAANSEWNLICATHNLLKLWRAAPVH